MAIDTAFQKDRDDLLQPQTWLTHQTLSMIPFTTTYDLLQPQTWLTHQTLSMIPFTTTYNPTNPTINQILKTNKHILSTSGDLEQLVESKFLVVKRRSVNIQHLLRSNINPPWTPKGSGPCNTHVKTVRSWNRKHLSYAGCQKKWSPFWAATIVNLKM